jgi:hypothetical protein
MTTLMPAALRSFWTCVATVFCFTEVLDTP